MIVCSVVVAYIGPSNRFRQMVIEFAKIKFMIFLCARILCR